MIKSLLFISVLGLVYGLKEPHPDCPEEGHYLLPHEYDCTKFYYCEGGEKFIEPTDCAEGTEFSYEQQVCVHPSEAGCKLEGPVTEDAETEPAPTEPAPTEPAPTEPAPTEPEPTEPEPTEPAPTEPAPTEPAPTEPAPTEPAPTEPAPTEPAPTEPAPTEPAPTEPAPTEPAPTEPAPTEEAVPTTESVPLTTDCERFENGCPVDFSIDEFFEHEVSCRHFYRCVFGQKVLQKCARGTVFNILIPGCDHPENVDRTCELWESSEETTSDPSEEEEEREIDFNDNGCPIDFEIPWYLPHEKYCNAFYQCNFGDKVMHICPPGTQFNPEVSVCDHYFNVNCQDRDATAFPSSTEPGPVNPTTPSPDFDVNENGCPTDGRDWRLPHEDCTKFYMCTHGNLVVFTCPAGLHFNPTTQDCDNPATAGCANGPCSDQNDCSEEESAEVTEEAVTNEPVTEDAITEDAGSEEAVTDETVTEEEATEEAVTEEAATEGAVTEDIRSEEEVTEDVGSEEEVTEGAVSEEQVTEDDTDDTTEVLPDDDECEGDDCEKTCEDKKCEEECHVLPFPHDDCDKFWVCYGNKAQLITCSNGLYFNPATHTCDYACNVNCDSLKSRVTPHHDGLSMYIPWHKMDSRAKQLVELIQN